MTNSRKKNTQPFQNIKIILSFEVNSTDTIMQYDIYYQTSAKCFILQVGQHISKRFKVASETFKLSDLTERNEVFSLVFITKLKRCRLVFSCSGLKI